eukprot:gnl/MRDRNA2_/MRDRNA2_84908_c0_seq1.p1 gnl/MRDRNA2_/MRDRNA2_84908_c0~~gnl/MRDRNA2_/MRDRNA2_84908_c0_seq1.p1  ORF type:complete len:107 (+),score=13.72 gnl/MRDRNA2_/MRDRNA2_84908_c0_seq1:495-815(+)
MAPDLLLQQQSTRRLQETVLAHQKRDQNELPKALFGYFLCQPKKARRHQCQYQKQGAISELVLGEVAVHPERSGPHMPKRYYLDLVNLQRISCLSPQKISPATEAY